MIKQIEETSRNQKAKRIAVFAAYSDNKRISNELIYFLKELSKCVDGIIFIADNDFSSDELSKISDYVIYADCQHHGKYDFGSYSKGFQWFRQSDYYNKTDEIIFCNDSVLGPYRPLSYFFEEKEKAGNPPVFGCTINHIALGKIYPHLQSYFFTVHKSVFTQSFFIDFFDNIKEEANKADIITKYEMGLTELFEKNNIKFDAIYSKAGYCDPCREFVEHFDQMLFIKKNRLKSYHTLKINLLLTKIGFPYWILKGKFVKKTNINKLKIALHLFLEPARIIRQLDIYKKRKYDKKIRKFKGI